MPSTSHFRPLLMSALMAASAVFANPLGFREYEQQITVSFPDAAAATAAQLQPRPLPRRYTLHFSARWDDSTLGHARTNAVQARHGIKGTFFFNSANDDQVKLAQDILAAGSTIGLHTVHHPNLSTLGPNRQFYEFMHNRIVLESRLNTSVVTEALPFCAYTSPERYTQHDIGRVLQAIGVIGAPEPFYPNFGNNLDYPEKALAESFPLRPGDRDINFDSFNKSFAGILQNRQALAAHPSVSVGIHSWHTPQGIKDLETIYRDSAHNPDWWYANHNDYGAYRYEALNARISKRIAGNRAVFTITRFRPEELGANVPLWLEVSGAKPNAVEQATLHEDLIELPHADNVGLPELYDAVKEDGSSAKFPFLNATLTQPASQQWSFKVTNNGTETLQDLQATFFFPPQWPQLSIRSDKASLAPGESAVFTAEQAEPNRAIRFQFQRAYYAARLDFSANGRRGRLYADLFTPAPANVPARVSDCALVFFPVPDDYDLAVLSIPGNAPNIPGVEVLATNPVQDAAVGLINTAVKDRKLRELKKPFAAIVEFTPTTAGPIRLRSNAKALFLNGQALSKDKQGSVTVTPRDGLNRVVCRHELGNSTIFLYLNDGNSEQPAVTIHPELSGQLAMKNKSKFSK